MSDIILSMRNGKPVVSSRQIAENFDKNHRDVLRAVDNLKEDVRNFAQMFFESTEADSYGREQRTYLMNRDGFTLLAMGFTGKAALEWKLKYIAAFNEMEKKLADQPQLTRSQLLATALIAAHEELEEKDKQIETMKPKALFADAVSASKNPFSLVSLQSCFRKMALTSDRTVCSIGCERTATSLKTRNEATTTCLRSVVWRWDCLKSKRPRFSTATTFPLTEHQRSLEKDRSTSLTCFLSLKSKSLPHHLALSWK